jgi:competence protein ComEA
VPVRVAAPVVAAAAETGTYGLGGAPSYSGDRGAHPPGVPVFGTGPLGRARTWLYVRCGLELRAVLALAFVLTVALGLAVHHYWVGRPRTLQVAQSAAQFPSAGDKPEPAEEGAATEEPASPDPVPAPSPAAKVTVDIAGKVAKPGLRSLPRGSRVADALSAAGGPLPGTDLTALNLARPLTDGEQILVGVTPPPSAADPTTESTGAGTTGPVHLNTATEAQLDALPGVGPVLAQHILTYRTQHGSFTSTQQLRQIPGIGPRKYATLQPLVEP